MSLTDDLKDFLHAARHRYSQVRHHRASETTVVEIPAAFQALLTGEVADRFRSLPNSDQAHLVAVATILASNGASTDLVTAGLIHDIGKSVPGIKVRLMDRIAKVAIARMAPSATERLANRQMAPRFGRGLWVLCRHALTGAQVAAASGYSERVQWLVTNHERSDLDDPELAALAEADELSFPFPAR